MAEPVSAHEPYYGSAESFVPQSDNLRMVGRVAAGCTACHLCLTGTQTVFGEGPSDARVMMICEQPGDKEDLAGKPFVGPAGKLLDGILHEAGIDRKEIYVTNAVKHFKWEASVSGKRIHGKPNRKEVLSCKPWLDKEIELIRPDVIVLLGATAAQALLGSSFRLTQHRGEFVVAPHAAYVIATIHPSALLRMRTSEEREQAKVELVRDLKLAAEVLKTLPKRPQAKLL